MNRFKTLLRFNKSIKELNNRFKIRGHIFKSKFRQCIGISLCSAPLFITIDKYLPQIDKEHKLDQITENKTKEIRDLEDSANNDSSSAHYKLALHYKDKDCAKAYEHYYLAAQLGDPISQYEVAYAMLYDNFRGLINGNNNVAYFWLTQSVENNNSDAEYLLGNVYISNNIGFKKGFDLLKQSAAQGNKKANFALGYVYENGLNTQVNYEKAIEYYKKSNNLKRVKELQIYISGNMFAELPVLLESPFQQFHNLEINGFPRAVSI